MSGEIVHNEIKWIHLSLTESQCSDTLGSPGYPYVVFQSLLGGSQTWSLPTNVHARQLADAPDAS